MTTPEITLPPLPEEWMFTASGIALYDKSATQDYARLAMAPLQERIRELEADLRQTNLAYCAETEMRLKAEAGLAALRAGDKVLVPKEPTLAILNALDDLEGVGKHYVESFDKARRNSYQRMLAAAPVVDGKAQEPISTNPTQKEE